MSSGNGKKTVVIIAAVTSVGAVVATSYYLLETKGYRTVLVDKLHEWKEDMMANGARRRGSSVSSSPRGKPSVAPNADGIRPVSTIVKRGYTKEDLAQFDGVKNPRILVSLKRKVYEVSPHFYGPQGHYHCFAGKEASRPLAKSQLHDKEANKYWVDCTEEELDTLDEYVAKFDSKYPVVGWFVPDQSFYDV